MLKVRDLLKNLKGVDLDAEVLIACEHDGSFAHPAGTPGLVSGRFVIHSNIYAPDVNLYEDFDED